MSNGKVGDGVDGDESNANKSISSDSSNSFDESTELKNGLVKVICLGDSAVGKSK